MKLLENIRILDLTEYNSFTSLLLEEYGAEVIKIERPGTGEPMREYPPLKNGVSPFGHYLNKGKKSVTIQLRNSEARIYIKKIIKNIDVIYENFKGGTMEKYGLSYEELKEINPRLIFASLTSFGSTGPLSKYPAFDNIAQAMSGLMDMTGFEKDVPRLIGYAIGDHTTSTYVQIAILAALLSREKTGKGQKVETSLFEALISTINLRLIQNQMNGMSVERQGNRGFFYAPSDIYKVKDGYIAITVTNDLQWINLCNILQMEELLLDEFLSNNIGRVENYLEKIKPILSQKLENLETEEIIKMLKEKVGVAKVKTTVEAINSDITYKRKMLTVMPDDNIGPFVMMNKPIKYLEDDNITKKMVKLGEHTREILAEIGVSDKEYDELKINGVI